MLSIFPIALLLICLYRINFNLKCFNTDYVLKDKTNSIKGVFILLVIITHSMSYMYSYEYNNSIGNSLFFDCGCIGQLVVVMFLFYSGYGVGESYKKKGLSYIKSFPKHRVLVTLLNFDIAVSVFIILNLLLGLSLTTQRCLLSLVGWESVGNSNWYIFTILLCYLATYIVLILPIKRSILQFVALFALCFLCLIFLSSSKPGYWFNTILCYPVGFLYSFQKESIESFLKKYYWQIMALSVTLFFILVLFPEDALCLRFNAISILFAMIVVMVTMKVSVDNNCLRWFGKNLFPVYIYMRLPMMFFEHKYPEMIASAPTMFVALSLLVTVAIAYFYRYWQVKL